MRLLRWGRSAYETDAQLDDERARLERLGVGVHAAIGPSPPVEDVEILAVTSKVRVDRALIARAPRLRLVVTTTSGHEHIDISACVERGIVVARSPLARRDAVVDTSLALGLSLLRCVPGLHANARQGRWARADLPTLPMRRTRDLVVGLVGHGVIGSVAAEAWSALGATVRVVEPRRADSASLDELASWDVVTLHCDLNPSTRRLFGADELAAMKPGSVLVNTARGGLVDVDALFDAPHVLAGLDVFPDEPFGRLAELASRPGTLLLPHAAGYHVGLGAAVADELEAAVASFLATGTVPHLVTG